MNDKYIFEIIYDLLSALWSQIPSLFSLFLTLPELAQEIVLCVILVSGVEIISNLVDFVMTLGKKWLARH